MPERPSVTIARTPVRHEDAEELTRRLRALATPSALATARLLDAALRHGAGSVALAPDAAEALRLVLADAPSGLRRLRETLERVGDEPRGGTPPICESSPLWEPDPGVA